MQIPKLGAAQKVTECCWVQVTLECRDQHQKLLVDVCKGFSERHHGCMWLCQAGVRLLCCAALRCADADAVLCCAVLYDSLQPLSALAGIYDCLE